MRSQARTWQPPEQVPGAPGTLMASRSNCQYARRVTGALPRAPAVNRALLEGTGSHAAERETQLCVFMQAMPPACLILLRSAVMCWS